MRYQELSIKIGSSISDRIFLNSWNVQFRLALENSLKGLVLNLQNVFYLFNISYNLVSLDLLHNSWIFSNVKVEILYQIKIRKPLTQLEYQKNSYFLKSLNLLNKAVCLFKINNMIYQWLLYILWSILSLLVISFCTWHKYLSYNNFSTFQIFFAIQTSSIQIVEMNISITTVSMPKRPKFITVSLKIKQNVHANFFILTWSDQSA